MDHHKIAAAAYAIIKNDKDEVLFLRRHNTGYMDGKLGLPSGHVEKNESFELAMLRELREEVAVKGEKSTLVHVLHRYQPSGLHDYVDAFYYVHEYSGELSNNEPNKCSELIWANPENVKNELISYLSQVFENINQNVVFSEIPRGDDE